MKGFNMFIEMESLENRLLFYTISAHGHRINIYGEQNIGNNIALSFDAKLKTLLININGSLIGYGISKFNSIRLVGGTADDFLHVDQSLHKFTIPVWFFPGEGNNSVQGGSEADGIVCGGSGNDSIITGDGQDTVIGGTGHDTITLGSNLKSVFGAKGGNTINVVGHAGGYIFSGDGGSAISTVVNTAGNNSIFELVGGTGDDTIRGSGFDTLWGGGGNDSLAGGIETHRGALPGYLKVRNLLLPLIPRV